MISWTTREHRAGTRMSFSFMAAIIFFNNSGTTSSIFDGPCSPKSAFIRVSILLNTPSQNDLNPGFSAISLRSSTMVKMTMAKLLMQLAGVKSSSFAKIKLFFNEETAWFLTSSRRAKLVFLSASPSFTNRFIVKFPDLMVFSSVDDELALLIVVPGSEKLL